MAAQQILVLLVQVRILVRQLFKLSQSAHKAGFSFTRTDFRGFAIIFNTTFNDQLRYYSSHYFKPLCQKECERIRNFATFMQMPIGNPSL